MNVTPRAAARLLHREMLHFVRKPSHIIAALATPAVIWILLASGLSGSVSIGAADADATAQTDYAAFLLPGVAMLVCVFSAIVSAMGLIDDKGGPWMRAVLVSPQPRSVLVLARVAGATLLACAQAGLVLLAGPLVGIDAGLSSYLMAMGLLVLVAAASAGFALGAAWLAGTTRGFHGIVNLVLLPGWLLSGAVFPIEGSAGWIRAIAAVNPLAWAHTAMNETLAHGRTPPLFILALLAAAVVASVGFAAACIGRMK